MASHRHLGATSPSDSWIVFPGGELEGRRPRVMCRACRERANAAGTLCFQCYRTELDRERALKRAGELDTASEARFQTTLPFEPVNRPRLERLRMERIAARRSWLETGTGSFVERQRRAQIAARHAFLAAANFVNPVNLVNRANLERVTHAAELQLPESWLPFVVTR